MITVVKSGNSYFYSTRKNQWRPLRASGSVGSIVDNEELDELGERVTVFQGEASTDDSDDLKALYAIVTRGSTASKQPDLDGFLADAIAVEISFPRNNTEIALTKLDENDDSVRPNGVVTCPNNDANYRHVSEKLIASGFEIDRIGIYRRAKNATVSPLAPYFREATEIVEAIHDGKSRNSGAANFGNGGQLIIAENSAFGVWFDQQKFSNNIRVRDGIKEFGDGEEAAGLTVRDNKVYVSDKAGNSFMFNPVFFTAAFVSVRDFGDVKITLCKLPKNNHVRVAKLRTDTAMAIVVGEMTAEQVNKVVAARAEKELAGNYEYPNYKFRVAKEGRSYVLYPQGENNSYLTELLDEIDYNYGRKGGYRSNYPIATANLRIVLEKTKSGYVPEIILSRLAEDAATSEQVKNALYGAKGVNQGNEIVVATKHGNMRVNSEITRNRLVVTLDDYDALPSPMKRFLNGQKLEFKENGQIRFFLESLLPNIVTGNPPNLVERTATQAQVDKIRELSEDYRIAPAKALQALYNEVENLPFLMLSADGQRFQTPERFGAKVMKLYQSAQQEAPTYKVTEVFRAILKRVGKIEPSLSFSFVEVENTNLRPGDIVEIRESSGDDLNGVGIIREDQYDGTYVVEAYGEKIVLRGSRLERTKKPLTTPKIEAQDVISVTLPQWRVWKTIQMLIPFTPKTGNSYNLAAALVNNEDGTHADATDGNSAISIRLTSQKLNASPYGKNLPLIDKGELERIAKEIACKKDAPAITWEADRKTGTWRVGSLTERCHMGPFPRIREVLWSGRGKYQVFMDLTKVKKLLPAPLSLLLQGTARFRYHAEEKEDISLSFINTSQGQSVRGINTSLINQIIKVGKALGADSAELTQTGSRMGPFLVNFSGGDSSEFEILCVIMPEKTDDYDISEDR